MEIKRSYKFGKKNLADSKCLCYDRYISRTKAKVILGLTGIAATCVAVYFGFFALPHAFAETADTTFEVDVVESLSVSITTPQTWASGNAGTFLRNTVELDVSTNDANGFTASMYASGDTALTNTADSNYRLDTLNQSYQRSNFPANYWGYSLGVDSLNGQNYGETNEGSADSYYYPLVNTSAAPITVLSSNVAADATQNVYFGAKADISKASGTYAGTVVISVVSGVSGVSGVSDSSTNPIASLNPAAPSDDVANNTTATYDQANDRTVYTATTTNGTGTSATQTTPTQAMDDDLTAAYTSPQGVTTSNNLNSNNSSANTAMLAAGLVAASTVATASGVSLVVMAKRRDEQ